MTLAGTEPKGYCSCDTFAHFHFILNGQSDGLAHAHAHTHTLCIIIHTHTHTYELSDRSAAQSNKTNLLFNHTLHSTNLELLL